MPVPSTAVDISTTAISNSPAGSDLIGNTLDEYIRATQAILKQQMSQGDDLVSASTLALLADGNTFDVTGTTTITGISSTYSWTGRTVYLKFDGVLTLTHNATTLILPGGANITTAAGDIAIFRQDSSGEWRCIVYQYASGDKITGNLTVTGTIESGGYLVFNRNNILGTVSQSAGIPTGAIIENGSNANGEYVRYADGTQICTYVGFPVATTSAEGALFRSAPSSWTFPAVFSAIPFGSCSPSTTGRWGNGACSTTTMSFRQFSPITDAATATSYLVAIGRWF